MGELDRESIQALRRIRNCGRVISLAMKKIEEQKEIMEEAKNEFKGLCQNYPQARESYYLC